MSAERAGRAAGGSEFAAETTSAANFIAQSHRINQAVERALEGIRIDEMVPARALALPRFELETSAP